jgi:hypothetical protein
MSFHIAFVFTTSLFFSSTDLQEETLFNILHTTAEYYAPVKQMRGVKPSKFHSFRTGLSILHK